MQTVLIFSSEYQTFGYAKCNSFALLCIACFQTIANIVKCVKLALQVMLNKCNALLFKK